MFFVDVFDGERAVESRHEFGDAIWIAGFDFVTSMQG